MSTGFSRRMSSSTAPLALPGIAQARMLVLGSAGQASSHIHSLLATLPLAALRFEADPAHATNGSAAIAPHLVVAWPCAGIEAVRATAWFPAPRVVALAEEAAALQELTKQVAADDAFVPNGALEDVAGRIRLNAEIAVLRRHLTEASALVGAAVKRKMARLEKGLQLLKAAHAHIERQLEEARERGRNAVALPASLVHELRTPLGAISGFADVMRREAFGPLGSDRYREYAQSIHQASGHLLGLVNDLMDLYKIEAGQLAIERKPVDLRHVVRSVFGLLALDAEQSKIRLEQSISPIVPPIIQTDEGRLRQVLINLVGNAIKFTSAEGSVHVAAERVPGGSQVAISVRDTGIGMSEEEIRSALNPFGQAKAGSALGRLGTGLGLPISKMLVERLGGTFELLSSPGAGTTATLCLPA